MQWNGSEANRKEKAKALDVCTDIKDDERGGKAKILSFEQGQEPDEFWEALGGRGGISGASSLEGQVDYGVLTTGTLSVLE